MDLESQQKVLARLAPVCRYFVYYAINETSRCLDFDGTARCPRPRTPTGPWCTGIIKRLQPMETLRTKVKECKIHDWVVKFDPDGLDGNVQMAETFLRRFPLVLSKLDNLGILTLSKTPISYFLLQTIGRLPALQELVILMCHVDDIQGNHPKEAIFEIHETPFPTLRQFTIAATNPPVTTVYENAFCAISRATTLRSMDIADAFWLRFLLPHISPQLVSLSGNFSAIPLDVFLRFIKTHAALEDLTVYSRSCEGYLSKSSGFIRNLTSRLFPDAILDFDRDDLPNLRSFSGPFRMAPKFIRSRPISRLALCAQYPLHGTLNLASSHTFTVFPHTHLATYSWDTTRDGLIISKNDGNDVWDDLKTIGGAIQELFVRFDVTGMLVTALSSCFPNLIRLQLELCLNTVSHAYGALVFCLAERGLYSKLAPNHKRSI